MIINKEVIMKNLIVMLLASILILGSNLVLAAPVNINIADANTLALNIKGIGMKKAEAIIAYRNQHGAFGSAEDLAKVRGIGKKTVEKNLDNLKIE